MNSILSDWVSLFNISEMEPTDMPSKMEDIIKTAIALAYPLLRGLHCVVVTLGQHGVLLCGRGKGGSISLHPQTCYEVKKYMGKTDGKMVKLAFSLKCYSYRDL